MRILWALARNTFVEALRDKVFYLLLGFGAFLFSASRLLAPLALGEERRVTLDVGLAAISLFGCLITIFVGHQMIFREVERKTLYFLFSRPIHRAHFVWGKFCGLASVLAVSLVVMGALLVLVLKISGYPVDASIVQALVLAFFGLMILAAIAVLIAAFTTPVLAGLLTLAAYVVGHGSGDLFWLLERTGSPGAAALVRTLGWILPRLDLYSEMLPVLDGSGWTPIQMGWCVLYALLYGGACLCLATVVLQRREFTL
ncbi:MAG: ABC transporter permease [Candidatus Eisenbacteria bacterium]|uniref:ABC transporter permease n=1 Tax=Eiseniibacteriota bacterium TaxID=2212470 RepID=A0A956RNS5_UNCEI|nr:ABC transporter permease [Candidatus Eisenbacteria bacterium]